MGIKRLLQPAVAVMNRLKYLQKFALFGLLFLLPIVFTLHVVFSEINGEIRDARKERMGIQYTNQIRTLLEHLQIHRGMVNAYLSGDISFKSQIEEERIKVESAIDAVDKVEASLGESLDTKQLWESIKNSWKRLDKNATQMPPKESFQLHTELIQKSFLLHTALIADALNLINHIEDSSGLRLDPEYESYYLMDTILNKLPLLIETVGQARGIGSGISARQEMMEDEKKRLIIFSGQIKSAVEDLRSRTAFFQNFALYAQVHTYIQNYVTVLEGFLNLLDREFIDAARVTIQPADYFRRATVVIDAGFRLYDAEAPVLDGLLKERIRKLTNKKYVVAGFSCLVLLLILYIAIAFYSSILRSVLSLKRTAMRIVRGDLSARVHLETKDELEQVGSAFNQMVVSFGEMLDERRKQEEQIKYMAFFDILTGLPNRALFNDRLQLTLSRAMRSGHMFAVMFLDLDRFKNINDSLGHDAGDQLLRTVADRLRGCLREGDTLSRMGGDEFMLLLPDMREIDEARRAAEKILDQMNVPVTVLGHELVVTASIGISLYPFDGEDQESLVKHADTAMYHAKNQGKNRYQLHDAAMNMKAEERLQLEISLRQALQRGEFILHYQPRMDLAEEKITGMEALIRWRHPQRGLMSPSDFIPIAEETGLIVPIGEWVLRTACAQNKVWQEAGGQKIRVSVNISAVQFQRDDFIDAVRRALDDSVLEPSALELELTESIVMNNAAKVIGQLNLLKRLGVQISIDDFGTGFSSLSYLKHFPIDTLKIDRSFIRDVPRGPKDTAITKTIIALGRRLQLNVVAEGVETEEQLQFLKSRKCAEVQGYLIGRPLSLEEAERMLYQIEPLNILKE